MTTSFGRHRSQAEWADLLAKAEARIAELEPRQATPFGAPVVHVAKGHVLDGGTVLMRRPLYEGALDDPEWQHGMIHAMKGAKCLGFDLFEIDIVPGVMTRREPRGHSSGLVWFSANQPDDWGTGANAGRAPAPGPQAARIRIWALVVAEERAS